MSEFHKELEDDPELLREFNKRRLTAAVIYRKDLRDFKKKHRDVWTHSNTPEDTPKKTTPIRFGSIIAIVAAVALVAVVLFCIWQNLPTKEEPDKKEILDNAVPVASEGDNPDAIDAVQLPIEILGSEGVSIADIMFRVEVYPDTALNVPAYQFAEAEKMDIYVPSSPEYEEGRFARYVRWGDRHFLQYGNEWYEIFRTTGSEIRTLLTVEAPDFLKMLSPD